MARKALPMLWIVLDSLAQNSNSAVDGVIEPIRIFTQDDRPTPDSYDDQEKGKEHAHDTNSSVWLDVQGVRILHQDPLRLPKHWFKGNP